MTEENESTKMDYMSNSAHYLQTGHQSINLLWSVFVLAKKYSSGKPISGGIFTNKS